MTRQTIKAFATLPNASLTELDSSFRLGRDLLPRDSEAVLCYGEDATIAAIRLATELPVQGFGTAFCASILTLGEAKGLTLALAKDCLSLAQLGCMASRFAIVLGDAAEQDRQGLGSLILESSRKLLDTELPTALRVALDHEALRLLKEGHEVQARSRLDDPLVYQRRLDLDRDAIAPLLSNRQLVIPLFFTEDADPLSVMARLEAELPVLRRWSASPRVLTKLASSGEGVEPRSRVCALGTANAPRWDGLHEGRPLFSFLPVKGTARP